MENLPTKHRNQILAWLASGAVVVAAMVVIGGITRLTHSGLSMVNWSLFSGTIPPMSPEAWQETFEAYKQSPEFQKINSYYSLEDFKSIFWWEYIHRVLGRFLGLLFIVPFIYFWIKKRISKPLMKHLLVVFGLGALQAFFGWFMVKSGLVDVPHVSHYRLAIHLCTAFLIISYILWVMLSMLYPKAAGEYNRPMGSSTRVFMALLSVQVVFGAFVAGLRAGLLYPSFPKMGDSWIAPGIGDALNEQGVAALIQSPLAVQFIHRTLGWLVFFAAIYLWNKARRIRVNDKLQRAYNALAVMVLIQFLLGVGTLVMSVPLLLAVLHQFGALLLLLITVYLLFHERRNQSTI